MAQYAISHGRVQSGDPADQLAAEKRRQKKERRRRERDVERGEGGMTDAEREKERRRKKRKSTAAAAASAANAAAERRERRQRSRSRARQQQEEEDDDADLPIKKKKFGRCFWVVVITSILLLIILIPVGVVVSKKSHKDSSTKGSTGLGKGERGGSLSDINRSTIPAEDKGTYLDPFTWLDTTDFNLTYTNKKVGGLPAMGLWDAWDDSTQCNDKVPALNKEFPYGKQPVRGVNLGGWLIIEPFITPSFFDQYDSRFGVVDEFTLSKQLGPSKAKETLEKHYSTFVNEDSFRQIRDAGLDHVRLPFGYWAVMTLDGDTFVPQVSWRYLLRAIEWARKYGLRVKLDLHSVPGGANGWNHSGKLGPIGWLNGTDGEANAQKTLTIHKQLSTFFSQPRYKNIITMYGLVNEPKMISLDANKVIEWSTSAYQIIRGSGYKGKIIFGDGFRGLDKWKGAFPGLDGMLLDVHQYVIFNVNQLSATHTNKIKYACSGWGLQTERSMNTATGFGPTIVGEWGQADTDCTKYLNNVGVGSRWEGTLTTGEQDSQWLQKTCPSRTDCSCDKANADPSTYTAEYKKFLKMFAEAQMDSFEKGWGWLYWTWDTENAPQWSYKKGLAAGILPMKPWDRDFSCKDDIPDFHDLGLPENY